MVTYFKIHSSLYTYEPSLQFMYCHMSSVDFFSWYASVSMFCNELQYSDSYICIQIEVFQLSNFLQSSIKGRERKGNGTALLLENSSSCECVYM